MGGQGLGQGDDGGDADRFVGVGPAYQKVRRVALPNR